MSYNCDTFKTKIIENLRIPIASFYKHERSDWHPDRIDNEDGSVTFYSCDATMKGTIENDIFICSSIDCSGEGSGTTMNWIIEPALKDSTGILEASCVWEGGDTINKITVKDGEVSWEDIEI